MWHSHDGRENGVVDVRPGESCRFRSQQRFYVPDNRVHILPSSATAPLQAFAIRERDGFPLTGLESGIRLGGAINFDTASPPPR